MNVTITCPLEPINDWIVIEPVEAPALSSIIVLSSNVKLDTPNEGTVVAAGEGKTTSDGVLIPTKVKVGDYILYSKYMGQNFKLDDVEYTTIREDNIIAKIKPKGE